LSTHPKWPTSNVSLRLQLLPFYAPFAIFVSAIRNAITL
jgi:hypothetical protein